MEKFNSLILKKVLCIFLFVSLTNCKKEQKKGFENFTFSSGNIHSYDYLKFNKSDTVYCLDRLPFEKKILKYTIMNKSQKIELYRLIDKLIFPSRDSVFYNNQIDDGTTFAFSLENNSKIKRIMIHENSGPKVFWKLGQWIVDFKDNSKFDTIQNKVEFDDFDQMISIP